MNKIIILDGYTINPSEEELNKFRKFGEVSIYEETSFNLTVERIGTANIVLTDSTYIGKNEIDSCKNIELICILATGLNSVDIEYAKEKQITVLNVSAYGADTVSQHAFALLFYGTNRLCEYSKHIITDKVHFWDFPTFELNNKTMGIIGFGSIAKRSTETALSLGMKVLVCTDYPDLDFKNSISHGQNLTFTVLSEIYKLSDVIFLHCPLTDEKIGNKKGQAEFINKSSLKKMKDGVIIINTARGKLINQSDLADALNCGKVVFAGLDVLAEEPTSPDNPLISAKNCFITPHVAWTSNDARKRIIDRTLVNLNDFLKG